MLNHLSNLFKKILLLILLCVIPVAAISEESRVELIETNWSFDGIFGTFDRSSLQRGYQVYQEVCSGCHSV